MSDCARCGVAQSIYRAMPKIVIELEKDSAFGTSYEIWVETPIKKISVDRGDPRIILYQNKAFLWHQTVFSMEHSRDEDCDAVGKHKRYTLRDGFPQKVKWGDVTLTTYSEYIKEQP